MNGVAMDVPDRTAKLPSGTGNVEMMFPPGADTAGLKNMSFVGPKEVKEEMRPPAGSGNWKPPLLWGKERDKLAPEANVLTSCSISMRLVCLVLRCSYLRIHRRLTGSELT